MRGFLHYLKSTDLLPTTEPERSLSYTNEGGIVWPYSEMPPLDDIVRLADFVQRQVSQVRTARVSTAKRRALFGDATVEEVERVCLEVVSSVQLIQQRSTKYM